MILEYPDGSRRVYVTAAGIETLALAQTDPLAASRWLLIAALRRYAARRRLAERQEAWAKGIEWAMITAVEWDR